MKLCMIAEGSVEELPNFKFKPSGWKRQAGHLALDALGLIPGPGEAADLANALWYAKEGEYLNSALSLISMIPEVGDIIGKGFKTMKRIGGTAATLLDKIQPFFVQFWPSVLNAIGKVAEWKPYIKELDAAVDKMFNKAQEEFTDHQSDSSFLTDLGVLPG